MWTVTRGVLKREPLHLRERKDEEGEDLGEDIIPKKKSDEVESETLAAGSPVRKKEKLRDKGTSL